MACKFLLFASLVAISQASDLGHFGYATGYAAPIAYATHGTVPALSRTTFSQAAPLVSTRTYAAPVAPLTYAAPLLKTVAPAITKVISEEPTVSEYSTFVKTAPALTKTFVHQPAPIVSSRLIESAPLLRSVAAVPAISAPLLSTYAAPAFTHGYAAPELYSRSVPLLRSYGAPAW